MKSTHFLLLLLHGLIGLGLEILLLHASWLGESERPRVRENRRNWTVISGDRPGLRLVERLEGERGRWAVLEGERGRWAVRRRGTSISYCWNRSSMIDDDGDERLRQRKRWAWLRRRGWWLWVPASYFGERLDWSKKGRPSSRVRGTDSPSSFWIPSTDSVLELDNRETEKARESFFFLFVDASAGLREDWEGAGHRWTSEGTNRGRWLLITFPIRSSWLLLGSINWESEDRGKSDFLLYLATVIG